MQNRLTNGLHANTRIWNYPDTHDVVLTESMYLLESMYLIFLIIMHEDSTLILHSIQSSLLIYSLLMPYWTS